LPILTASQEDTDLTLTETGASQLLSTAAPTGMSSPYDTAQDGWTTATPLPDPWSGLPRTDGSVASSAVGQTVNWFSGTAGSGDNPNGLVGGGNIEPFGGFGSGTSSDTSSDNPLASPNLLAMNGPGVVAPSLTADQVGSMLVGATPIGQTTVNGTTYAQYLVNIDGQPTYLFYTDKGPQPQWFTQPAPQTPAPQAPAQPAAPSGTTGPAPPSQDPAPTVQAPQPQPPPLPPPSNTPQPQQSAGMVPPPGLNPPSQQEQPTVPPDAAPPGTTNQPGAPVGAPAQGPVTPFDPMANNPLAKWLLYGNDTPILDFLTSDRNLQAAQNAALALSVAAATVATGGALLEAAPAIGSAIGGAMQSVNAFFASAAAGAQSGWMAMVPAGAGAAGMVASNPGLADELGELESELPALGNELEVELPEIENTAQSFGEFAETTVNQWRTPEVENLLQEARDAGLRVTASGPNSWTPRQIEAAIEYQETYNRTLSPRLAGTAAHEVLEAAPRGPDRMYFGLVAELKTSLGVPDLDVFINALQQAETRYAQGDPVVVQVFDMVNGVKYFVMRGP
jgi:hypothetical protein